MRSWKSLGPKSRAFLFQLRENGPIRVVRPAEQVMALRLHDEGLLTRGRTANDWTISQRGLELSHGKEE